MDFPGNFIFRGSFDVAALRRAVEQLPERAWQDAVGKVAPVHRASRQVFFKNDIKPEHYYGTMHAGHARLRAAVTPILRELRSRFSNGYSVRVQLSRHLPGEGFEPHDDKFSFTLMNCHRIHVPIVTNSKVWFAVGTEKLHMGAGEAWEINNARVHSGKNGGKTPRVHLIFDVARPIQNIEDRLRYFVNLEAVAKRCGYLLCRPQLEEDSTPDGRIYSSQDGDAPKAAGIVENGLGVSFNYSLEDFQTGELLSKDLSEEPLSFVPGLGQLPPLLERKLRGLRKGERFEVALRPEEGFGAVSRRLLLPLEKKRAAALFAQGPVSVVGGEVPFFFRVEHGTKLVLNANHPFAGRKLRLNAIVRSIRRLEPDEHRFALYRGPTLFKPDLLAQAATRFLASPETFPQWGPYGT